jgi:hypothetical protein
MVVNRLPAAVFTALVAATVGAFFITQHLKTENPFINGLPRPDPPAINPIGGGVCKDLVGDRVSFKRTKISFYLMTHSQVVNVLVFDSDDEQVATASPSQRYMHYGHRAIFTWNGHLSDGQVAPDGDYGFRVALPSEGVAPPVGPPITVIASPPKPQITDVRITGSPARDNGTTPIISPSSSGHTVTIRFTPGAYKDARIQIFRTDLPGPPREVFAFGVNASLGEVVWDGKIHRRPAPAGTYLVGMRVTNQACTVGTFPVVDQPPPGSTPHAGVTVRNLAAEPPVVPVAAGSRATIYVDSRLRPYSWRLRAAGANRVLEHGSVSSAVAASGAGAALRVKLPALGAGLYTLTIRSGPYVTAVPLVAAAAGRRGAARVLVVVPALTWQGQNPVDDTGGGLPDTLAAGDAIDLDRPLVDGLPADYANEQGLLAYLASQHDAVQLTTDVALAAGSGPKLAGHTGVILDGSFRWLPARLATALHAFAAAGGSVVSAGAGSLTQTAPLALGARQPTAGPPSAVLATDPFGARHAALAAQPGALMTVLTDRLGIFGSTIAFAGLRSDERILPPAGVADSLAGVAEGYPSIAGFRLGRGSVVEIGIENFGAALGDNVDAQELVGRLWRLLSAH